MVAEMSKQVSLVTTICKGYSLFDCPIPGDRSVSRVWSTVHVSSIWRTPFIVKRD